MTIGFARRVAAFLVFLCAFAIAGMPTAAAREMTQEPAELLCSDSDGEAWADTAAEMFRRKEFDAAAEIYRAVLRVDPTDECAVKGMHAVATQTANAATEAKTNQSDSARLGQQFADMVAKYVAPLTNLVLTVLGAAVFLVVLARLVTPLVTGSDSHVVPMGLLRVLNAAGYAAMAWALWLFGVDISLPQPVAIPEWGWRAVIGLLLVAFARGRALRLAIDVRGSSGSSDINASQYVAGRLGELGSEPPRGLRIPANSDVTSLPDEALSVLPESKVAKAVVRILQVVRPAVPWRAVICVHDSTTVTVAMTRNGRRAGAVTTLSHARLNLPTPAAVGETTTRQLLTAAAAHILIQLSKRHPQLSRGLCGTTQSTSLAMFAIATNPAQPVEPAERRRLITGALAVDPANDLARAVDHYRLALQDDAEGQLAAAKAAERHYTEIAGRPEEEQKGYEALRLRLLFLSASTRANAMVFDKNKGDTDNLGRAAQAYTAAIRELGAELEAASSDKATTTLADQMRAATYFQLEAVARMCGIATPSFPVAPEEGIRLKHGPVGGPVAFDRACWLSMTSSTPLGPNRINQALDDLRIAATNPRLGAWAHSDPSLKNLRDSTTTDDFEKVVGEAPATQ